MEEGKITCDCCGTPVAERVGDELVIVSRHHGQKHVTRIPLSVVASLFSIRQAGFSVDDYRDAISHEVALAMEHRRFAEGYAQRAKEQFGLDVSMAASA